VIIVISATVGCRYFLPGQQLPSQLQSVTALAGSNFGNLCCLVNRDACVNVLRRETAGDWTRDL